MPTLKIHKVSSLFFCYIYHPAYIPVSYTLELFVDYQNIIKNVSSNCLFFALYDSAPNKDWAYQVSLGASLSNSCVVYTIIFHWKKSGIWKLPRKKRNIEL